MKPETAAPPAEAIPAPHKLPETPAAPAAKAAPAVPKAPEAPIKPATPAAEPATAVTKASEASTKFAAPVAKPVPPVKPIATPEEAAAWAARIPSQKRPPPPGQQLPQEGVDKTENVAFPP